MKKILSWPIGATLIKFAQEAAKAFRLPNQPAAKGLYRDKHLDY